MTTMHTPTDPAGHRARAWLLLAAVGALMLAGCAATTEVGAVWVDPQFKGRSFAGQKVWVVCDAGEQLTLRRLCEDRLAEEVAATGGTAVRGPDGAAALPDAAAQLPAAQRAGAVAVLRGTVTPAAQSYNPGPQFSIGIGGFGGGRTSVGGGVGVALPAGAGSVSTGHALDLGITEVASGELVWSARSTAPPSKDLNEQITELARTTMAAARSAGVI
jgi:hypothetical protein